MLIFNALSSSSEFSYTSQKTNVKILNMSWSESFKKKLYSIWDLPAIEVFDVNCFENAISIVKWEFLLLSFDIYKYYTDLLIQSQFSFLNTLWFK